MTTSRNDLRRVQAFFVCAFAILSVVLLTLTLNGISSNGLVPVSESGHVLPPPIRLRIPRLNIDTSVLPMGLTKRGGMEVPENAKDVGWFALGSRPGEIGSAVLAGHRDTLLQPEGIFRNLETLVAADDIYIENASGGTLHFRVLASHTYPYNQAPLPQIFAGSGGRLLNLITCAGAWDAWTYDHRLVVYTQLVEGDDNPPGRLP